MPAVGAVRGSLAGRSTKTRPLTYTKIVGGSVRSTNRRMAFLPKPVPMTVLMACSSAIFAAGVRPNMNFCRSKSGFCTTSPKYIMKGSMWCCITVVLEVAVAELAGAQMPGGRTCAWGGAIGGARAHDGTDRAEEADRFPLFGGFFARFGGLGLRRVVSL